MRSKGSASSATASSARSDDRDGPPTRLRGAGPLKALVTGANGFAGRHLAAELEARGYEVYRWVRQPVAGVLAADRVVAGDLTDAGLVRDALDRLRPQAIFHLAAQASVSRSWADPAGTLLANQIGQLNLIQSAIELGLAPRILVCGSNEEYGIARPDEMPLREDSPLRPANPYAVSKVAQDLMGLQYFLSHGLPIIRVRPFNHFGPGQGPLYVIPSFARQIAQIEAGRQEPILLTGEPSVRRDFTDVRDMVRGYADLLESGTPGEVYNLGSGRPRSIAELIEAFQGFARVAFSRAIDPRLLRPIDVPVSYCDAGKAKAAVGWEPRLPFETSLADVLEEWRAAVREMDRV